MAIVVQAPRASTPYPWAKFVQWMVTQGFTQEEVETMIANGVEPTAINMGGFELDPTVAYPGLPSLEGSTMDFEPGVRLIDGHPLPD